MTTDDELRDITHLPNVTVKVKLDDPPFHHRKDRESWTYGSALDIATGMFSVQFQEKYGREPRWDNLMFRGCFTTFDVVLEVWEEE